MKWQKTTTVAFVFLISIVVSLVSVSATQMCMDNNLCTDAYYYNGYWYCNIDSIVTCPSGCTNGATTCSGGVVPTCSEGYMYCGTGTTQDLLGDPYKCINGQKVKQVSCGGICLELSYNNAVCYQQNVIQCSNRIFVNNLFCDGSSLMKCNMYTGTGARYLLDGSYLRQNPTDTNVQYSTVQNCQYGCSGTTCSSPPAPTCTPQNDGLPYCQGSTVMQNFKNGDCSISQLTVQNCGINQQCTNGACIDNPIVPPIIPNVTTCTPSFLGEKVCNSNSVYQDYKNESCDITNKLVLQCAGLERCENGQCISPQCPTLPKAGEWSKCLNGTMSRTNYKCSADTVFEIQEFNEDTQCESDDPDRNAGGSIFQIILSVVVLTLVLIGGLFFTFKYINRRK